MVLVLATSSFTFFAPVNYIDLPTQVKHSTIKLKFNVLRLNNTEIQQLNDSMVPFLEPYFNRSLFPLHKNLVPAFENIGTLLLEVLDKIRTPYNYLKPKTNKPIDSICTINVAILTKLTYSDLLRSINLLTYFLPETYSPADRAQQQSNASKVYVSVLYYVQDVLRQFLFRLNKQLNDLIALKNYQIPENLFYTTDQCLDPKIKYTLTPLTSTIDEDSIQTTIDTQEYPKISQYLLHQPIDILGHTLQIPNLIINGTVVKTLSCPITQQNNYINCKLVSIPSNCEQAILKQDTKNILYNCPFSSTTNTAPKLTMEGIIFNKFNNLKINERLLPETDLPSNPQNLPYLINNKGPIDIDTSTGVYHYPTTLRDFSIKLYPIKDIDLILKYFSPFLETFSEQDIIIGILVITLTLILTYTCFLLYKTFKTSKPTLQTYSASYKPNHPIILKKVKK